MKKLVSLTHVSHRCSDGKQLETHSFVKATLEGVKRSHARPVVKKEPLTVEMLQIIVDDAERPGSLRLATAILLAFVAFFRFDELVELRPCDIVFSEEMITVKILKNKGDQLRQGDEVLIARIRSKTCPVGKNIHIPGRPTLTV